VLGAGLAREGAMSTGVNPESRLLLPLLPLKDLANLKWAPLRFLPKQRANTAFKSMLMA